MSCWWERGEQQPLEALSPLSHGFMIQKCIKNKTIWQCGARCWGKKTEGRKSTSNEIKLPSDTAMRSSGPAPVYLKILKPGNWLNENQHHKSKFISRDALSAVPRFEEIQKSRRVAWQPYTIHAVMQKNSVTIRTLIALFTHQSHSLTACKWGLLFASHCFQHHILFKKMICFIYSR